MLNPQILETVHRIQLAMGLGYSGMGAWCLVHPPSVIALCLTPQYAAINRTTSLLMRCFGAQAMTAGLLLSTSSMTIQSFTIFGLSMIPYLGFNAWFGIGPGKGMFTKMLWMDFVGNCVFMGGSLWCAKLMRQDEKSIAESRISPKTIE